MMKQAVFNKFYFDFHVKVLVFHKRESGACRRFSCLPFEVVGNPRFWRKKLSGFRRIPTFSDMTRTAKPEIIRTEKPEVPLMRPAFPQIN
jgi:hypothetical protein